MIKSLTCLDFRNYESQTWDFDSDLVIFYGANGAGKTNILEAISCLSMGKSWRENSPADLIRKVPEGATIPSAILKMTTERNDHFKLCIEPHARAIYKNDKKISMKSHLGEIPSLLFCPEFLHLFSGSKRERLNFFDRFLSQTLPLYRDQLSRAYKAHKQKTHILRNPEIYTKEAIAPWNTILAQTIPAIIEAREYCLGTINPFFQAEWEKISQNTEPVHVALGLAEEVEASEAGVLDFFEKNEARERAAQKNFMAPQRDDFVFSLRDMPLTSTASRGEERSVLLSLIAAQKTWLTTHHDTTPILLLDDVFSELDTQRQTQLEALCTGTQAFFTTTHEEHFAFFGQEVQKIFASRL